MSMVENGMAISINLKQHENTFACKIYYFSWVWSRIEAGSSGSLNLFFVTPRWISAPLGLVPKWFIKILHPETMKDWAQCTKNYQAEGACRPPALVILLSNQIIFKMHFMTHAAASTFLKDQLTKQIDQVNHKLKEAISRLDAL